MRTRTRKWKEPTKVRWDEYWMINNPSIGIMKEELERITKIQEQQIKENWGITNRSMDSREFKINTLKKVLTKK